jgi:hypothetical protein
MRIPPDWVDMPDREAFEAANRGESYSDALAAHYDRTYRIPMCPDFDFLHMNEVARIASHFKRYSLTLRHKCMICRPPVIVDGPHDTTEIDTVCYNARMKTMAYHLSSSNEKRRRDIRKQKSLLHDYQFVTPGFILCRQHWIDTTHTDCNPIDVPRVLNSRRAFYLSYEHAKRMVKKARVDVRAMKRRVKAERGEVDIVALFKDEKLAKQEKKRQAKKKRIRESRIAEKARLVAKYAVEAALTTEPPVKKCRLKSDVSSPSTESSAASG